MYLYFDKTGLLKEQINDPSIRQGNIGVNKIYVYFDNKEIAPSNIYARYRDGNGNLNPTQFDISITTVSLKIPFNRLRDLKYFNYTNEFPFYVITIPSEILEIAGATSCTVRIVPNDEENADISLSTFTFMIEESVEGDNYVASDDYVNLAQFQYLLNVVNHKTIDFTVFDATTTDEQTYTFERAYTNKPLYVVESDESVVITLIQDDNDKYTGISFTMSEASESVDEILVVFYFRG